MMKRVDRINYYLNMAETAGQRGTCIRKKYGAIIVKNDRIVSTGYVGAPRKRKNCCDIGRCLREELKIPSGERYELCRSVHAEANAIIQAHPDEAENSVLYLYGVDAKTGNAIDYSTPCEMCRRMIRNAKISEVVSYRMNEIHRVNPNDWIKEDLILLQNRISHLG